MCFVAAGPWFAMSTVLACSCGREAADYQISLVYPQSLSCGGGSCGRLRRRHSEHMTIRGGGGKES